MRRKILLSESCPFIELDRRLTASGWRRASDPAAPPPILTDEPDMAAWHNEDGDSRLFYMFHPAISLRLLSIDGENAGQIEEILRLGLPTMGMQGVEQLLRSARVEELLRGLYAAAALDAYILMERIAGLMSHPDPLVTDAAEKVLGKLLFRAGAIGIGFLSEWKSRHPDLSALFAMVGGSRERNQLLRWLIRDRHESNPNIDAVLRTGLQDSDWEVRTTAMLAAARLKAVGVQKAVQAAALPAETREGVNATERRMLEAIRRAALALLAGQTPPPLSDLPPATREAMQAHILRCVAGMPENHLDRVLLLIHSLTEPLPPDPPGPDHLPYGIAPAPDGYRLHWGDLALCWVPPVSHWLGDDLPRMRIANPIRRHRPERGFFITRKLFVPPGQSGPYTCPQPEAEQWCRKILRETGLPARLPTAEEWEMAVRGPDGRRFPWGNNAPVPDEGGVSPWGVQDLTGAPGQWTGTPASPDGVVTCGGVDPIVCAMGTARPSDAAGIGFRIVIPG